MQRHWVPAFAGMTLMRAYGRKVACAPHTKTEKEACAPHTLERMEMFSSFRGRAQRGTRNPVTFEQRDWVAAFAGMTLMRAYGRKVACAPHTKAQKVACAPHTKTEKEACAPHMLERMEMFSSFRGRAQRGTRNPVTSCKGAGSRLSPG